MAIDLYSDNSGSGSPRISFSYDLSQSDTVPVEQLLRSFSSSSSSVDFNFCIHDNNNDQYQHSSPSMADELFYNGKILPTQIKPKTDLNKRSPTQLLEAEKPRTLPVVAPLEEVGQELKQNNNKSSFWGFKRSSSCGSGYARSLCPITLLSRSHSTGSTTSTKRSSSSSSSTRELINPKRGFQKGTGSQKPPLRKSGYGHGNGIRVNPVLNLGFGSFFSGSNKNKNKK
uniref:uncharacterized protein LOC122588191 n=1 Tax=Erigeron canadensis TaxID=72917 RepID=UPI001CB8F50D|nr:uncharacterized protein LOC122588191 [Erigeron canadensis]